MQLTENFSLDEMTRSQTAMRKGINNTPTDETKTKLGKLCKKILQPLRDELGHPLVVTSGYRSLPLNHEVGGSDGSQHCVGEAADIVASSLGSLELAKKIIAMNLPFDQLIEEGDWVHVSYSDVKKRGEVLTATFTGNGARYARGLSNVA